MQEPLVRALWAAAKSAGGMLRISPATADSFPGEKHAWVTITRDQKFGDLIVIAHSDAEYAGDEQMKMGPFSAIGLGCFMMAATCRVTGNDVWLVYWLMGLSSCTIDLALFQRSEKPPKPSPANKQAP
jgi:hypothetical protein